MKVSNRNKTVYPYQLCFFQLRVKSIFFLPLIKHRSSLPEVFCKRGVLKNFTKLTGKHLCRSLFLNKVAGLRPANSLKKRYFNTGVFL